MVHKGRVVKVRMGCKGCGKICGFGDGNGMPGSNRADPTLHVMAYLDDLLVPTTPLPMGLHCQIPPRSGIEEEGPSGLGCQYHSLHAALWYSWPRGNDQPNHPTA